MKRYFTAALAVAALAGCASTDESVVTIASPTATSEFLGTTLDKKMPEPDVTLTSTKGKPFNIAQDTKGKVVALYIGYSNCPDVCPTTMADLSIAMNTLPKGVAKQIDVVMITSDPQRDTPKRLKEWLSSFSYDSIGLTGPYPKIQEAAETVGVFLEPPKKNADGTVTVEHGAQVILFGKDGQSDLIFTSGFAPEEVAHDLQKLVEG
jgi:protein SCO1